VPYYSRLLVVVLGLGLGGCVDLSRPSVLLSEAEAGDGRDGDGPTTDRPIDTAAPADGGDGPEGDAPPDVPWPPADADPDAVFPPDAPLLANGKRCSAADQCASSLCVDGYCCDTACAGTCQACHLMGSEGTCGPVPNGQDPREICAQEPVASCGRDGTCDGQGSCRRYPAATECASGGCTAGVETAASTCDGSGTCRPGSTRNCAPNMCTGGSCASTGTNQNECQTGFFCDGTRCTLRRTPGAACTMAFQCASGMCIDGVCCSGPCSQACHACNLAGSPGTCQPIPSGQDPQSECPAEAATTCGRAGGCNGAGGCRLHTSGTSCSGISCTGSIETAGSTCNGSGVCVMGQSRSCGVYLCSGTTCGTSCTSSTQCQAGNYCSGNACVPFGVGPKLYWKFDEPSGLTAMDSSGNAFNGLYTGAANNPLPSAMVPPVRFPDPASRAFVASSRHAVRLANAPSALKPANNMTVSLWYRTTSLDTGHNPPAASEALSMGNNYFIRIRATDIAFTRRSASGYVVCFATIPTNHLDGNWHHVAGVVSPSGTKVYFDGTERCTNTSGDNLAYDSNSDLFVGRHGNGETQWDFDGNLDDVRIYTRALPPDEVAAIAGGFF
jgi:hypothetical protein